MLLSTEPYFMLKNMPLTRRRGSQVCSMTATHAIERRLKPCQNLAFVPNTIRNWQPANTSDGQQNSSLPQKSHLMFLCKISLYASMRETKMQEAATEWKWLISPLAIQATVSEELVDGLKVRAIPNEMLS